MFLGASFATNLPFQNIILHILSLPSKLFLFCGFNSIYDNSFYGDSFFMHSWYLWLIYWFVLCNSIKSNSRVHGFLSSIIINLIKHSERKNLIYILRFYFNLLRCKKSLFVIKNAKLESIQIKSTDIKKELKLKETSR